MLHTTMAVTPPLSAALRGLKPEALRQSVARGMTRGTKLIVGQVQKNRLTGKGPYPVSQNKLGVRSGRLRQSLRATPAVISGAVVETQIGTNVKYAAAHEFGFSGTVTVKAHRAKISQVFGRKLSAPLTVQRKAYPRKVHIPERAPIRTGIAENMPVIETEIIREIQKGAARTS